MTFGTACHVGDLEHEAPRQWEQHKPRVWRLRGIRTVCTVSPSLERREWLWTVQRKQGIGLQERAHGRAYKRSEAMSIGAAVLDIVDTIETRRNRERYEAGR